jgi:hypothetical protein
MPSKWKESEGGRKVRFKAGEIVAMHQPKQGTQCHDLLRALRANHRKGMTVRDITRLGIAAYTARLSGLRDMGWRIVNRRRWSKHPRTGRTMLESRYFLA